MLVCENCHSENPISSLLHVAVCCDTPDIVESHCKTCHAALLGSEKRGERCNDCLTKAAIKHGK